MSVFKTYFEYVSSECVFSTVGDILNTFGDILSTLGDFLGTVGMFSTIGMPSPGTEHIFYREKISTENIHRFFHEGAKVTRPYKMSVPSSG